MGMAFSRDAGLIDLAGSKREIRDLNLQIPALPHIGMNHWVNSDLVPVSMGGAKSAKIWKKGVVKQSEDGDAQQRASGTARNRAFRKVQRMAELFAVLADPSRLRLISALAKKELYVCDLAAVLKMGESAESHQLRLLRSQRLVKYRRAGRNIYYSRR